MKEFLTNLLELIKRENLLNLVFIILVIVFASSLAITYFEPDINFISGIWWSIVTLTTVGYGDISPTTGGGRAVAAIIMFFGIGLLGMLSANLATMMISRKLKENKGMGTTTLKKHLILCEWNHRSSSVLKEIRADSKTLKMPVVLIADINEKPVDDPLLVFISGAVNEESLEKANIQEASTVVVLGDDSLDATSRDAKAVLTTLTIESLNPDVYTVVEIVNKANEQHCVRANADEIIVGSELSSHLIATAATDHGMSTIVSEIISARYGNDLFSVAAPGRFVDKPFLEVMMSVKSDFDATILGIQKGRGGKLLTNPEKDYAIQDGDYLVLMATKRPQL